MEGPSGYHIALQSMKYRYDIGTRPYGSWRLLPGGFGSNVAVTPLLPSRDLINDFDRNLATLL
jgi:hypothetical protein